MLLCGAGVGLNLLLGAGAAAFETPLYLDTVGTVAVAAMGGYLPGVLVGFATNIIKSFSDPTALYYGVLNVLIALAAANLSQRGWFKKIIGCLGSILVFTFIGGGLGCLMPWFMEGLDFDSAPLAGVIYETGLFGAGLSNIISNILTDLPDKTITVILSVMIIKIIPEGCYHFFTFTGWMQTPLEDVDEALTGSEEGIRVMSLKTKVFHVFGLSLITVAVAATGIGMAVYNKTVIRDHTRIAQGTAEIAARLIPADRIDDFLKNGEEAEGYTETKELLAGVLNGSTDICYIYVYKIKQDGVHVVFDLDTENVDADEIGAVLPFDEGFKDKIDDLLAGERVDPIITNDRFGHLLTAYEPVYDDSGKCVCYVGADVDISRLNAMERSFLAEVISVFLGFFILLVVFIIWLLQYQVILPINSITEGVDAFSKVGITQESLDKRVKNLRKIGVRTGDEIEKLYRSICRMTLDQAEQMRSIRRLSDSTSKMQDGLIITMADMVENRDSDTGAHIQKTAAYVKIIVEGLKKKGYYPEKITPKFMSDVVRSAPLHDVGKINIPDGVLNKPAKLNDEEYEIMKTHAAAGKRIMEDAISTVGGENYLKEARNMAAYHHERWDGKGYPEGLHGEVIPLSARIMAVADVFDALTSARVYKPAFPFEKALSIIEEGKGTQFDPKCVEAFMDSLDEIKIVFRKYNREV
ncbi:MAG: HD domain-containing protein [Lachnospiraceae bacterium]|nr:HD domain-containing protein [Lachnospiraceae bacterium]